VLEEEVTKMTLFEKEDEEVKESKKGVDSIDFESLSQLEVEKYLTMFEERAVSLIT
jgi:hypothetical protein